MNRLNFKKVFIFLSLNLILLLQIHMALAANSSADGDDAICRLNTGISEIHVLGKDMGYFAQPLGSNRIMFMGVPEADNARYPGKTKTWVYNLATRKMQNATKDLDPYPTPDGEFYVHPNPIEFFDANDIARKGESAKPVGTFNDQLGWYESVGQFPDPKDGVATYRVVTATSDKDMKLGTVRDYRPMIDLSKNAKRKIIAIQAKPVSVCNNVSSVWPLALPILSRNGQRLSVMNGTTGTTQIYKLNMPSGHCELELDLGVPTGKGAFSFDGTYFAAPITLNNPSLSNVVVVNLKDERRSTTLALPPRASISATSATFSPNGALLITGVTKETADAGVLFVVPVANLAKTAVEAQKKVADAFIRACPKEYASVNETLINYLSLFMDRTTCQSLAAQPHAGFRIETCNLIPTLRRPQAPTKTSR